MFYLYTVFLISSHIYDFLPAMYSLYFVPPSAVAGYEAPLCEFSGSASLLTVSVFVQLCEVNGGILLRTGLWTCSSFFSPFLEGSVE